MNNIEIYRALDALTGRVDEMAMHAMLRALRRDWACQVLDARGACGIEWTGKGWSVIDVDGEPIAGSHSSRESARMHAALVVLKALTTKVQKTLGNCP